MAWISGFLGETSELTHMFGFSGVQRSCWNRTDPHGACRCSCWRSVWKDPGCWKEASLWMDTILHHPNKHRMMIPITNAHGFKFGDDGGFKTGVRYVRDTLKWALSDLGGNQILEGVLRRIRRSFLGGQGVLVSFLMA